MSNLLKDDEKSMQFWNADRNDKNLLDTLTIGSKKVVWWKCEQCGKSYKMSICSRIRAKTNYCFDCKHEHIGNMNRIKSSKKNNLFSIEKDLITCIKTVWNQIRFIDFKLLLTIR